MIVVMGASGRVGGAALEIVERAGRRVRGIRRRARGTRQGAAEWVTADALDTSALASAFAGAEAVFVLNPVSPDAGDVHAEADRLSASIARALDMASVPYAVVLSSQGAHLAAGTGVVTTLHRFEAALGETRTALTLLRPAYFLESWVPLARHALETGELPAYLDPVSRAIDAVSARDVGMIAARHLMAPHPGVVNIVGSTRCSDEEAAETIASLHGRPVRLIPVPAHQVAAAHAAAGLGDSLATEIAAMYRAINGAGIPFEDGVGRCVSGSVTLRETLGILRPA